MLTEFITEKEVLERWPLSRATLFRARRGGLPFTRIGAFVCYRPDDLNKWFGRMRSWASSDKTDGKGELQNG